MAEIAPRLLVGLFLVVGIAWALPALAQEKKELFVRSPAAADKTSPRQQNPERQESSGKTATVTPQPKSTGGQQQAPLLNPRCSAREIEAFLKAQEMLMGPLLRIQQESSKGLSEPEAEEFAVEAEKVYAKMDALMKQPGFMEKYSELSIRCYDQVQALKK